MDTAIITFWQGLTRVVRNIQPSLPHLKYWSKLDPPGLSAVGFISLVISLPGAHTVLYVFSIWAGPTQRRLGHIPLHAYTQDKRAWRLLHMVVIRDKPRSTLINSIALINISGLRIWAHSGYPLLRELGPLAQTSHGSQPGINLTWNMAYGSFFF